MQFLYDGLGITTGCESGYRASVNPRLHIEFALMRLAFLMKKPEAVVRGTESVAAATVSQKSGDMLAGAQQTQTPRSGAEVQPQQSQTPQRVTQSQPEEAAVQRGTATAAAPTVSQGNGDMLAGAESSQSPRGGAEPAAVAVEAEQPRERRSRASRASAGLSMKAMMEDAPQKVEVVPKDDPAPSEEFIRAKWPELALKYKHLDRLSNMLSTTTLTITDTGDCKTVVFQVVNEAQKTWVESKMLHDLEGNLRVILQSMKVYLRVEVAPDDTPQEKKIYMPSEQATVLMNENDEVKNLIKDFVLDIK